MPTAEPPRILIADDNPQGLELLEAYLDELDAQTKTAADGEQTLKAVKEWKPDLLLLDIMMPRMSGFEVCKRLRADPATAELAVLMVTALDQPSDVERGVEAGADDFLTKPINKLELLLRVKSMLKGAMHKRALDKALEYFKEVEQAGRTGAAAMIPELNEHGYLPPGVHLATLEEIAARFGSANETRRELMESLGWLVDLARQAGVLRLIVNGSFVTSVKRPGDVDCVGLVDRNQLKDQAALDKIDEGVAFISIRLAEEEEFTDYQNRIFAMDRRFKRKGMIEVILMRLESRQQVEHTQEKIRLIGGHVARLSAELALAEGDKAHLLEVMIRSQQQFLDKMQAEVDEYEAFERGEPWPEVDPVVAEIQRLEKELAKLDRPSLMQDEGYQTHGLKLRASITRRLEILRAQAARQASPVPEPRPESVPA